MTTRSALRGGPAAVRAALLGVLSFPVLLTAILLLVGPLLLPSVASLSHPLDAARIGLALHLGVYVLGAVMGLVGVLSALHAVHADTMGSWRSVGRAYRGVIRVLAGAVVLGAVAAVGLYFWYLTPVAGLAWLGYGLLRHRQDEARPRPGRSALVWLVPFFPLLYALVMVAVLPLVALSRPRSVRHSLVVGHALLAEHWRRAALAIVVAGAAVTAVTVAATTTYAQITGPSSGYLGTATRTSWTSAAALAVVYVGLTIACALWAVTFLSSVPVPPATPSATTAVPAWRLTRSRVLRWNPRLMGGAASLAVVSLLASMALGGVANAVTTTPALVPTLTMGIDGTDPNLSLSATVSVDSGSRPQGTVQFLDGGTPLGAPVALTAAFAALTSEAYGQANNLAAGDHQLSFTYTPTDPAVVDGGTAAPVDHVVKAGSTITLSAPAGTAVGGPAVITVTVASSSAGAFPTAPDGDVTLQSLGDQTTLTLSGGQATWNLAALPDANVEAAYAGSALYLPSSATTDVVTGTQVSYDTDLTAVPPAGAPLGAAAPVNVTVAAPSAPYGSVINGTVEVFDGTTSLASSKVSGGRAVVAVPTSSLGVGTAALTATFTATSGYNPSSTALPLDVTPATTSVAFGAKPTATPVYGATYHVLGTVTSSINDLRTVQLEATTPGGTASIVATQQVTGAVDFALTTELPASLHFDLRLLVTGDASHLAASSSDLYGIAVAPAPTTTTLSTRVVGTQLRVGVVVGSPAVPAGQVFGEVTFTVNSIEQFGPYPLSTVSAYAFLYTPISSSPLTITASYRDPASARTFLPSVATAGPLSLDLATGAAVQSWSDGAGGAPTPLAVALHVSYPGVPGTFAPSGVVSVRDVDQHEVAQISLFEGQGTSQAFRPTGINGQYFLYLPGNGTYREQYDTAPPLGIVFTPQLSFTATPGAVLQGAPTSFTLGLTGVDTRLVTGTSVSDEVNGVTTVLTTSCCPQGSGTFTKTLSEGVHTLTATVSLGTLGSVTATAQVTVTPNTPTINLRVLTPATEQQLGKPVLLEVTALPTADGTTGFTAGTPVRVQDADGSQTQALWVLDAAGAHATLSLLSWTPGLHTVTATSGYGMFASFPVASNQVSFTLAPQAYTSSLALVHTDNAYSRNLTVEAVPQNSVVGDTADGLPFQLPATLTITSTNPKAVPQSLPVQLTYDYTVGRYTNYSSTTLGQQLPGTLTLTLTVPGDGHWVAPSSATLGAVVLPRETQIVIDAITPGHSTGRATTVAAHVEQVPQTFYDLPPLPLSSSLPVTVTLDGGPQTCTTTSGTCSLPFAPMVLGTHTLSLAYAGDGVALATSRTVTYVEELRPSYLSVRSPAVQRTYQVGDRVTFTWQASVSGPLTGSVTMRSGSAQCSAAAAVGTCTLTLAGDSAARADTVVVYEGTYTSTDPGTAVATDRGGLLFAGCMPLTVQQGTYTLKSGAHCTSDRTGVLAGSVITLRADVPPSTQALAYWKNQLLGDAPELNPAVRNGPVDAVVTAPSLFVPTYDYRPICYQLHVPTMPNGLNDPTGFPAQLHIDTAPNCTNPQLATALELYNRDTFGEASFAAGTQVDLSIRQRRGSHLVLESLSGGATAFGASQYSGDRFGVVTMDRDRTVDATYKSADCTPNPLISSAFGTLTVTSSVRPLEGGARYFLRPYDGSCTTFSGEKGYVPGTELTVKAKANPGYGLRAVYVRDNAHGGAVAGNETVSESFDPALQVGDAVATLAPFNLPGVLAGEDVGPTEKTVTITVPKDGLRIDGFSGTVSNLSTLQPAAYYGVLFAHASCVQVHLHLAYPVTTTMSGDTNGAPKPGPLGAACGGAGWKAVGERQQPFTGGYRTQEYVGQVPVDHSLSTWISTTDFLPAKQSKPTAVEQIDGLPAGASYAPLNSDYYGTNGGVPSDIPHPAYIVGTSAADLLSAQKQVSFYVTWHNNDCRKPVVQLPNGGGYRITSAAYNYACADPTTFTPGQLLLLAPIAPGGKDSLARGVVSLGNGTEDPNADVANRAYRHYFNLGQPIALPSDSRPFRLNFCADMHAAVSFRTAYGEYLSINILDSRANPETYYQSGTCPLGMGEVGAKTWFGLRGDAAQSFALTSSRSDTPSAQPAVPKFLPDGSVRPPSAGDNVPAESTHFAYEMDALGQPAELPSMRATLKCYEVRTGPRVWLHTDLPCLSQGYDGKLAPPRTPDTWVMAGANVEVGVDLSSTEKVSSWSGLRPGESSSSQNAAFVMNGPDRDISVEVRNLSSGEALSYILSSVAQRIVAGVVQYVVAGVLAEIGILDSVRLLASGVSAFLNLVGINDGAGKWVEQLGAGLDISLGTLQAFATCAAAWSSDGGGSTASGGALSGASSVTGAISGGLGAISNDRLLGDGAIRTAGQDAGTATDALRTLSAGADLFGANGAAYFADPAQSWGNLAPAIGSCVSDHVGDQLSRF